MISLVVAGEPIKEATVLAIVVVVAADGGKMAADVALAKKCKSYENNVDNTDPHRNFTPDKWEALVCHTEKATIVIRVTKGATRIEPPAVYTLRIQTLMIRLCPKFLSEDLRTVLVLAVAPSIPDSNGPMVHVRYKQSY